MRIGIICYPTYGGSGIVATELGKELAARGHSIHFISYATPFRLNTCQSNVRFHEVDVASYPLFDSPPYTLALATKMVEVVRSQRLDLLHCHYAIPHSVSAFLAKSMLKPRHLPVITTLHGTDITLVGSNRSYLPITRFSIEESDGVTAVSRFLKDATHQTFATTKAIEIIPNFVNCRTYERLTVKALHEKYAPRGERVVIHLSNFRPVKRPKDVVEIFNQIRSRIPAVLLMVGDGPERAAAEWLARHYGIQDAVHFLGKRENIEELLSCSDLMLLPSENESFGLAALEAMAFGVPAVVSRVGGLPEVVTHGVDGYLAPPGAVEEMAEYALDVLCNEKRLSEMGALARETVFSRFNSETIIPLYERVYEQVLQEAGNSSAV